MKIASIIIRILMGLMFAFASVVVLFHLVPEPPRETMTGDVLAFHDGLVAAHYLTPTLKIFELLCAICFLTGFFVPLAAVVIFPATLNILFYHSVVDTATPGLVTALLLMAGNLFLAYYYRSAYAPLFEPKYKPE